MSFLNNLINRAQQIGHTVANDASRAVAQVNPLDNGRTWVNPQGNAPMQAAQGQAPPSAFQQLTGQYQHVGTGIGLGGLRSLVGTAQGLSGLYDLATPGVGTNRFSNRLNNFAKTIDTTAHNEGINPMLYHGSQLGSDLLQFAAGAGEAKAAAAGLSKIPKVAQVVEKAAPVITKASQLERRLLPAEDTVGRLAKPIAKSLISPSNHVANAAMTANYVGQNASKGGQTTPSQVAETYAQNLLMPAGLSATGALAREAGIGAHAGLGAAKRGIQEATGTTFNGLKPQQILTNPADLKALSTYHDSIIHGQQLSVPEKQAVINQLHSIKDNTGLNFISGSNLDRANNINDYMNKWSGAMPKYQEHLAKPTIASDQAGGLNNQRLPNPNDLRQQLGQLSQKMQQTQGTPAWNAYASQADKIAQQLDEADIAHYQARNAAPKPPSKRSLMDNAALKAKSFLGPLDQAGGGAVGDSPIRKALQGGEKQRGLTTGMKQSAEFSPQLQNQIQSSYQPFTDKAATMSTNEFIKQPLNDSYHQVLGTLAQGQGYHVPGATGNLGVKFGKQEVSNAGAVMKALDQSGRHDEAQQVHDLLAQKLTNAGQTSQATKLIYNRTPEGLANMARRDLTNAGTKMTPELRAQLDTAISNIKNTADGTKANDLARKQLDKLVGTHIPTGLNTKIVSLYKTGILSSPKTAVKVAMVQIPNAIGEHAADFVGAPIDRAVSAFTGKRAITAPGIETTKAVIHALPGAISDAKTRFKDDIVMPNSSGMAMSELSANGPRAHGANFGIAKDGGRTKLDQFTGGASSTFLNGYTSSIGRVHGAFQTIPYELRRAESLAQSAVADAKNRGLTGAERTKFIQDYQKNPPKQALEVADQAAQYSTNQQKTALGQAASGLQHTLPGGQFIAPITRIPGAVATQVVNYSPAGFVKTAAQAGLDKRAGTEFNQAGFSRGMARATIGTGLLAGGTALAAQGRVSGAYPKDRATQTLWQSANIPANSVYVGGKAYPGAPWKNTGGTWQQVSSPGGAPVQAGLAGGAAYDGYKQGGVTQAVLQGGQGAAQIVSNQPYLTGLSGAMGAINTPNQAKSFLDQSAGSVVPNIVRDVAQATDPLQRQTAVASPITSMKNAVTNGIPGLRENNLPQVGIFGNTIPRNNGVLNALLNPLNPQTSNANPLTNAMGDIHNATDINGKPLPIPVQLDKKLTVTGANGKKTILSDAQRTQLVQQSGQAAQQSANQLINTDVFKKATPEQQSKLLADVVNGQRELAKQSFGNTTKLGAAGKAAAAGRLPQIGSNGKVTTGTPSTDNYKSNDAEYKALQDKYKTALSDPKTPATKKYEMQRSLDEAKIGANYSKNVRDLYAMGKTQLTDYATKNQVPQSDINAMVAYGDALQAAGLGSNKYRDSKGNLSLTPKAKGSGSSGRTRSSTGRISGQRSLPKISIDSSTKALNKRIASAKVKGPSNKKLSFSAKTRTGTTYKLQPLNRKKVA